MLVFHRLSWILATTTTSSPPSSPLRSINRVVPRGGIIPKWRLFSSTTTNGNTNSNKDSSDGDDDDDDPLPLDILAQKEGGTTVDDYDDDDDYHKSKIDIWDDRIGLQHRWTLPQKGWRVDVEWKPTPYTGAGLFAAQDISRHQILRRGILGRNLIQFTSLQEIEDFCNTNDNNNNNNNNNNNTLQDEEQEQEGSHHHHHHQSSCLLYVKDYLWAFNPHADERGYDIINKSGIAAPDDDDDDDDSSRFFGMWVPGNGLNHSREPNTVYKKTDQGIDLVALRDIADGEEMLDDYRRHGTAPRWLLEFADKYQVTLNFAECNDFVDE
jgi:hypothetical protein